MMDKLVLEQFMICMLLECQVLVKESGVQSCKDMEDMLRSNQKPKKWTTVRIQGDEYLVRSLDIETFEVELSDTNDEKDLPRDPQSLVSEIPPKNGQQVSQELQNPARAKELSRGQDQKSLLPEIIPETGELEGLTPKENLEKDLMEYMEETRTRQSQELELPKRREGEVSTKSGYRRGSPRGLRRFKRKLANIPKEEGATSLDKGHFSGQFGSHSVVSPSTVGPTSPPEGKEAKGRRFPYQSQVILHQRTHTGERPFRCSICRIHTGEKPYCCDLCPKKLTHNSTLRAHKRTHTKEKPFRYEHCDKAFSHRWNLKVHRCTHSGLKPYMCPECHSAFRQLGSFKRHQKTHSE
uniref:C2H2-type domain-containing protein n=1 Tax=Balaenoptera musculus TaxID=9771 RepID=A0A8C0D889_BALMU